MGERGSRGGGRRSTGEAPSAASVAVAAVSGAAVLALVGYLAVHAVRPEAPARIEAEARLADVRRGAGDFSVPVEVRNAGGEAARDVIVEAWLADGGGTDERARFTLDYLAGGERKVVVPVFRRDPRASLAVRVVGYEEP